MEPTAGKGDIPDAIKANYDYNELHIGEPDAVLRNLLSLKGYPITSYNFLQHKPEEKYDKVIMNPPLANGHDIDYVMHAFKLLKPGGRVVATINKDVLLTEQKKNKAFQKFLRENNAFISSPIKSAFTKLFSSTGYTVHIVAINQDGSPVKSNTDNTDVELLELEAEAELELLKMRVELERKKKKSIKGLSGIDENKLRHLRQKAWAMQERLDVLDFK